MNAVRAHNKTKEKGLLMMYYTIWHMSVCQYLLTLPGLCFCQIHQWTGWQKTLCTLTANVFGSEDCPRRVATTLRCFLPREASTRGCAQPKGTARHCLGRVRCSVSKAEQKSDLWAEREHGKWKFWNSVSGFGYRCVLGSENPLVGSAVGGLPGRGNTKCSSVYLPPGSGPKLQQS